MRFLITGGAGFIGANLANHLSQKNHEVRVLDDLSSGNRDLLHSRILFTRGDVNDIPRLWSLLQEADCVYHLAARVSVAESKLYPHDYNHVNVGGTVSLLEAMRDAGVRRVVLASSGAIYGQQARQPVAETAVPQPDSPYAVSKLAAEQYLHTIGRLWGIETVALRIFNAYGPHQNLPVSHAPVVPRFLRQIASQGSLVLYGDGLQSRDFVYITDVVNALVQAAVAPSQHVNRRNFNIGTGTETSVRALLNSMAEATGQEANYLYNHQKSGGVQRLVADISQAAQALNYRPAVSLHEGLRRMVAEDVRFHALQQTAVPL